MSVVAILAWAGTVALATWEQEKKIDRLTVAVEEARQAVVECNKDVLTSSRLMVSLTAYLDAAGNTHASEARVIDAQRNLKEAEENLRRLGLR